MAGKKRAPLSPILRQNKRIFDLMKNTTSDYAFMMDPAADVFLASPTFVRDYALPSETLTHVADVLHPLICVQDRRAFDAIFSSLMDVTEGRERQLDFRITNAKGDLTWLRLKGKIGLSEDGHPNLFVGTISQLARRNAADSVTGLLNRYQFTEDLGEALRAARETGKGGGLLVMGIDNFRTVNEAFNHEIGDVILREISECILQNVPRRLSLYRLDGDEFGLIYPEADEEMLREFFIRVQREFAHPQVYDGRQYLVTMSAGMVFYPQAARDPLVLHKYAQAALDTAKAGGKNRLNAFSKEVYNRWLRSLTIQEQILEDVKAGCRNFELYFQPQVAGDDQHIVGAETLLRWKNEKGHMVAPMEFIRILEETKTIVPVGRWIFEQALRVCKEWRKKIPNFCMSVNMSYEQIKDLSFLKFIEDCLHRHDMPPDAVVLELTESKIVSDLKFVNAQFDAFRLHGIKIAMDDFGTGYSSLSSLKNLNCDIIKIDRAFVMRILDNHFDQKLVEYTVELCHSIGKTTCIEGVESQDEYDCLVKICKTDTIQGYLFGRPEPQDVFEQKFLGM
ncbi:bifunctional diguanylate cyclase/phosphodiesterase [Selenomonas sp. oral taxon 149]|uniref:sensor domain-containing protein n=1 Tax=Selenomonas sp. oral taxon 149 TaxID=712535 RepID=UPI0001E0B761|nr:bifunctional diguanylate cyclase/phosphodiesterase [Selenomonas sp. oral taxon 149]EFM23559.1 diguanylate cyclase (GGDEF) domain protein [Selenomonas sp. oral taxon 149 str. 67H29BP]